MRLLAVVSLFWVWPAMALVAEAPLPSAEQEARARYLFSQLRCMVCDGQSLEDSNAVVAADMRSEVRKQVSEGLSNSDIMARFVQQYGEAVRMSPPVSGRHFLLWAGPLLFLLVAFMLARGAFSRRAS
jgi:cytochrome c-type biogenesis protein CcmH